MHTMTRRTWNVLAASVVAISALTATATTAVANHQFNDVPQSSFFHEEIAAIFDAGCASGFGDGSFRPGDPTTRGQFTFWLNNCGGRVAFGSAGVKVLTGNTESTLAEADITSGALPTGGGFVIAIATVATPAANCGTGCVIEFRLRRGNSIIETVEVKADDANPASGAMQAVFPVNGGSDTTVKIGAAGNLGVNTVNAEASLTLLYVPFAGDGTGGGQEAAPA